MTVVVDMPRTVVTWQFSSQPSGIGFGLMLKTAVSNEPSKSTCLHVPDTELRGTTLCNNYC